MRSRLRAHSTRIYWDADLMQAYHDSNQEVWGELVALDEGHFETETTVTFNDAIDSYSLPADWVRSKRVMTVGIDPPYPIQRADPSDVVRLQQRYSQTTAIPDYRHGLWYWVQAKSIRIIPIPRSTWQVTGALATYIQSIPRNNNLDADAPIPDQWSEYALVKALLKLCQSDQGLKARQEASLRLDHDRLHKTFRDVAEPRDVGRSRTVVVTETSDWDDMPGVSG